MEITKDKVTELFRIIDEFCKVFDAENAGKLLLITKEKPVPATLIFSLSLKPLSS